MAAAWTSYFGTQHRWLENNFSHGSEPRVPGACLVNAEDNGSENLVENEVAREGGMGVLPVTLRAALEPELW